ncbi:hypothetical protein ACOMHN_066623 [Nucella lapillus]
MTITTIITTIIIITIITIITTIIIITIITISIIITIIIITIIINTTTTTTPTITIIITMITIIIITITTIITIIIIIIIITTIIIIITIIIITTTIIITIIIIAIITMTIIIMTIVIIAVVCDSDVSCPVQLLSAVTWTLWGRVDVVRTSGGRHSSCPPSSSLLVFQANETGKGSAVSQTEVQPTCMKGDQPAFWTIAESLIISPPADSRGLLLKITPAPEGACHGRVLEVTAPTDDVLVIKDPPKQARTLQYSRSAWCRYVVSGQNEADHVMVNVEAELCELKGMCGDYVTLYDGPTSESPLLYDSANRTHVTIHVTSTGRHVMLEYGTDERENRGFIQAEFNSVPDREQCRDTHRLTATRVPQNLSSINYPRYYPVNAMCQYCMTSDDPDDVIHIHVLDSDMTFSCSDFVEVYDGREGDLWAEHLGRWCGRDRPSYVSTGPTLCLLFRSDSARHGTGWLLAYRAAPAGSAVHSRAGEGRERERGRERGREGEME